MSYDGAMQTRDAQLERDLKIDRLIAGEHRLSVCDALRLYHEASLHDLRLRLQEGRVTDAEARGDHGAADFARQALGEARVVEYRRQVEHNPTDLRCRFQLGEALFATQKFDDSIAELQQAVKDPKVKADSLLMLGQAFAAKDMDELALGQLEKALDASSDTGEKGKEILYAMGSVAQNMGQTEQALAHFSRILEQDIGFKDVQQKIEALRSAT